MRVFISYSHEDKAMLDRLHVHLASLLRDGLIEVWVDREILAGSVIDDEIKRELEATDLFLLLISPDFIASDYCVDLELQRALERHAADESRVVPILVQPCDYWESESMKPLRRLKALPEDGKPISKWTNVDDAFYNVVQELRCIIKTEVANRTTPAVSEPAYDTARHRVKRDFDEFDQRDFLNAAFIAIKDCFRRKIGEIDAID